MWLGQYGGAKVSRFDGAKEAIIDIISDSSLQAGANFGFGHWNGGERDVGNTNNYPEKDFVTKMMDVNIIKMAGIIVLHTPKVHQSSVMFILV